jgi:hypothetical protein
VHISYLDDSDSISVEISSRTGRGNRDGVAVEVVRSVIAGHTRMRRGSSRIDPTTSRSQPI